MTIFVTCTNDRRQHLSTDIKKMKINGSVKSINQSIYMASERFGEIEIGELITGWSAESKYEFNSAGYKVKEFHYFQNGKSSGETEWFYDDNNRLIKRKENGRFGGGGMTEIYDEIKVMLSGSNHSFIYNDDENLDEIISYDSSKDISQKIICNYNKDKLLTTVDKYNAEGERVVKYLYNYHPNGQLKQKIYYDSDGKISYKVNFDTRGFSISLLSYNESGFSKGENLFKNDENGNTLEENWIDGETHKYQYDKNGNETSFIRYDSLGNRIFGRYSKYEYDEVGNWVKKVDFDSWGGKVEEIDDVMLRTIEYY